MLLKDRLNNTYFKLLTKRNLQQTSGSNYWNCNSYRSSRMLQQLLKLGLPSTKRFQQKQKTALKIKLSLPYLAALKIVHHTLSKNNDNCYDSRTNSDERGC